jgi:hypothetical protein
MSLSVRFVFTNRLVALFLFLVRCVMVVNLKPGQRIPLDSPR